MQHTIGSADLYLTSNPQVTFWKQPIKRHTKFSLDHTTVPVQGTADFGQRPSVMISKAGDLLLNVWVEVTLPNLGDYVFTSAGDGQTPTGVQWVDKVGLALIKSAELEIGGQRIERLVPEIVDCWTELSEPEERVRAMNAMWMPTGNNNTVSIPLKFYFHDNPSLAIPLCAIMYHDIRINFELERAENLLRSMDIPITGAFLAGNRTKPLAISLFECHVTYVMLDPEERRRFTDTAQEYLITTTQFNGADPYITGTSLRRFDLTFSNPVKELIWVYTCDEALASNSVTGNRLFDYNAYAPDGPRIVGGETVAWTVTTASSDFQSVTGATIVLPNPSSTDGAIVNVEVIDSNRTQVDVSSTRVTPTSIIVRIAPSATVSPPLVVNARVAFIPSTGTFGKHAFESGRLVLMGTDRFKDRQSSYFNEIQTFEHHKRVPKVPVFVYSFAMWPEEPFPSGTVNFSRIDSAALVLNFDPSTPSGRVKVFARAFNVLRVDKGIVSLVYTS
jgi:Major capsid protein N-terminus/Large eukaryotic DNA virus major capsid protein